jgi:hypothetical protein
MNVVLVHCVDRLRQVVRCASVLSVAVAGAGTASAAASHSSSSASIVNEPAAAVWQAYELQFHYFASHTYYSCSGLESRLEAILRELGADKDVRASVTGCFGTADVGNMLNARIKVRMPVAAGDAPAESFLASSKVVTVRGGRQGASMSGDCELLEQVRDQILPALKLERVKDDLNCIPGAANSPNRSLQVRALLPEAVKP